MKLKNTLIVCSLLLLSVSAYSQKKNTAPAKKTTPAAPALSEEQKQKNWMTYMTPGDAQKRLAADEGDWNEELTFWMTPGAEPTKAQAKCSNKMILDGRYQESVHTGMMMGMPFEGHGTIGYDNSLNVYQSTWIDNMGTGIMFLQGKFDSKTNSITYTGKGVDPETGKLESIRQVIKIIDDNTRLLEMYETKNGKEFKNMEIKMTR